MPEVLLATGRADLLGPFVDGLAESDDVHVRVVGSAADALEKARSNPPQLVIIDRALPDMQALELVVALLKINAMIHTAVVSSLSAEAFHEVSEGLGVMPPLPDPPGPEDARQVIDRLRQVLGSSDRA